MTGMVVAFSWVVALDNLTVTVASVVRAVEGLITLTSKSKISVVCQYTSKVSSLTKVVMLTVHVCSEKSWIS